MPRVHHMVLVRFKPDAPEATPTRLFAALAELKRTIPGILSYSGGPYSSPEGLNQGYTHGFLMTFESARARDVYLPHPDHEKVKSDFLPFVEAVVAFDFEEDPRFG